MRSGDTASPTFININRNSSLRETSLSAVHRTTSSGYLEQKYGANSATASPHQDRRLASKSDASPFSGISTAKASSETPTGNISNLRSTADGKGTSTSRTSTVFTVIGAKSQSSLTSRLCGSEENRLQDGKLNGSGVVKTSMAAGDSTQMLPGYALVKERQANASGISSKSQCVKNPIVDILSSDSKPTSGKVVQDKLKVNSVNSMNEKI